MAQVVHGAAVALGGAALAQRGGWLGRQAARFGGLRARGEALGRFLIELLRHGRGAALALLDDILGETDVKLKMKMNCLKILVRY